MPASRSTAAPTVRISNQALLAGLRLYAARVRGRRFTCTEFNAWPNRPFCAATVITRFGSWRNALIKIGIHDAPPRKHAAADLVKEFEQLWRRFGRPPGVALIRRHTRFSIESYRRRWGSPRNLAELITQHRRGQISRENILHAPPPPTTRQSIPISTRWQVFRRDRFRCALCGQSPAKDSGHANTELHLDHITPVSRGGTNAPQNLRTLCRDCNLGKAAA